MGTDAVRGKHFTRGEPWGLHGPNPEGSTRTCEGLRQNEDIQRGDARAGVGVKLRLKGGDKVYMADDNTTSRLFLV